VAAKEWKTQQDLGAMEKVALRFPLIMGAHNRRTTGNPNGLQTTQYLQINMGGLRLEFKGFGEWPGAGEKPRDA
jgi:hypothetical protein